MKEAVEPFYVVIDPPLWGTLHMTCVHIETATETLINGFVLLQHFLHQQFLLGRTHGNEYNVGPFRCNIVDELLALIVRLEITIAVAHNLYAWELCLQFMNRLFDNRLFAANKIERFLFIILLNNRKP